MKKAIPIHKCKYEGELIFFNPTFLDQHLRGFKGKHLNATFRLPAKNRSLEQNAYYWAVVLPAVAEWVGEEDIESIHETMKSLFNLDHSKKIIVVRSTATLSTVEFNEYVERIVIWAAKQGVNIPKPNEDVEVL